MTGLCQDEAYTARVACASSAEQLPIPTIVLNAPGQVFDSISERELVVSIDYQLFCLRVRFVTMALHLQAKGDRYA